MQSATGRKSGQKGDLKILSVMSCKLPQHPALFTLKGPVSCRGRNKPSKFEPPREDDEEALVAELAPLANDKVRCLAFTQDLRSTH